MSQVWFTSDEHIGHANIIKFCKRPFHENAAHTALYEMHEELIARHNHLVKDGDTVYHIGDMFWKSFGVDAAISYMKRLNGRHIYIHGNHDELFDMPGTSQDLRHCFDGVHERLQIYPEGAPKHGIVLDHYAGRVWHDSDKGNWQLYGHTHAEMPEIDPLLAFDVGVDANHYCPVSLDEVRERMDNKLKRIMRGLGVSSKKV